MSVKLAIKVAQRKRGRLNFHQRKAKRKARNAARKRSAPLNPTGILFGKNRDRFFKDHFEFIHVK